MLLTALVIPVVFLVVSSQSNHNYSLTDFTNHVQQLNIQRSRNSCETSDSKEGECVKPSRCEQAKEKIDPTTAFDIRSSKCHYLLKCCPLDLIKKDTENIIPEKQGNVGCGWSNPGASVLRATRDYADFGEFRWMVALLKTSSSPVWKNSDYIGGGSLIHPSVVLTVAHYVSNKTPNMMKCRAGEWDTRTVQEAEEYQERNVKSIRIHPDFVAAHLFNDGALLLLKKPFDFNYTSHIGVGCLGSELPPQDTLCFSMGWGKKEFKGDEYANVLKKVHLELVAKNECEQILRQTRLSSKYYVHSSLTCARGVNGIDTLVIQEYMLTCRICTNGSSQP
ncbi:unnamed protein product [Leptidea sinapis]|uniref:Peptidase S1 domain-containing protein n=1 Tax=Leptidea sinapis TaxID=189913 RepID=A0A5E4QJ12_9NEOP|nr:unnamed protein product [Leptidea sinapis]